MNKRKEVQAVQIKEAQRYSMRYMLYRKKRRCRELSRGLTIYDALKQLKLLITSRNWLSIFKAA